MNDDGPDPVVTTTGFGIVVGIDGSAGADGALTWAIDRIERFGRIRPVYAWDYPLSAWAPAPFGPASVPPVEEFETAAQEAAADWTERLGGVPHDPTTVARGDAGAILVGAASEAALLVLGTRSHGAVRAAVIGSVGRHCADHSTVPLVIVPDGGAAPSAGVERVVVGVDGSENAAAALRWAVATAADEADVTALCAWQTPIDGPILFPNGRFDIRVLAANARRVVDDAADKVCAELGLEPSRIGRETTEGDPRWVLAGRSETADLLVLGRRGRTGLTHLILGSTTTALIHRPQCPTVVVPT